MRTAANAMEDAVQTVRKTVRASSDDEEQLRDLCMGYDGTWGVLPMLLCSFSRLIKVPNKWG